jgi:hypothetical protein
LDGTEERKSSGATVVEAAFNFGHKVSERPRKLVWKPQKNLQTLHFMILLIENAWQTEKNECVKRQAMPLTLSMFELSSITRGELKLEDHL